MNCKAPLVYDVKKTKKMKAEHNRKMSFNEAAEFLGYKKNYLYQLTSKRKIPFSKPTNGKIFFDRKKLQDWVLGSSEKSEASKEDTQQMLLDVAMKAVQLNNMAISEPSKQLINGEHYS